MKWKKTWLDPSKDALFFFGEIMGHVGGKGGVIVGSQHKVCKFFHLSAQEPGKSMRF